MKMEELLKKVTLSFLAKLTTVSQDASVRWY